MPLESNIKKVILAKAKKAIDELEKSRLDGMRGLFTTLLGLAELVSDEAWNKEFKLSALVFGGAGASTEREFDEMDKEKQGRILKAYTEVMNAFYKAVEEENISKVDEALKSLAKVFMDEMAL